MLKNYVELRASSAYSFLQAASNPEDLVETAAGMGMGTLALADADGVYGMPRFVKACRQSGIRPICGARIKILTGSAQDTDGTDLQVGDATDDGRARIHRPVDSRSAELLLLCRDLAGWQNLCELITAAHSGQDNGRKLADLAMLERHANGLVAIAGGADGPILSAANAGGRDTGRQVLDRLVGIFGTENTFIDLQRHGSPAQERANRYLMDLGEATGIGQIATNDVRYATADRSRVMDVLLAIGSHTTLDSAGKVLPVHHRRFLRHPDQMRRCFADLPGIIERTAALAESLTFDLHDTGYRFPEYPTAPSQSGIELLRQLVSEGVRWRYGDPTPVVTRQITHELEVIGRLDLAGYFLLVNDISRFCRDSGILAQGRGSAANSAVCYALGITAVDPIAMGLLFERFLSEERGEWPDIDLDLPSGDQRETVIQHVYRKYGHQHVGMTCAAITFRGRNAARQVGSALGLDPERLARLCRLIRHYDFHDSDDNMSQHLNDAGLDPNDTRVAHFVDVWHEIQDLPRHIGQHNGGLVISGTRLDRVVPIQPAAMPNRFIIQWDKDDIADMRIIKVDLLGLGMLAAISQTIDLVEQHQGVRVDLAHLPQDDKTVWDMLGRADTIGVFQIESRAQMATLPRMRPRCFYDLVVEVAIIRPGPIVGKMVHPYLNRRTGREKVTYAAPCLEPILKRTLGIPLFQEQLMRMVMAAAGFTAGEAEELRRAMGSRRSRRAMDRLVERMHTGMAANGIDRPARDQIVQSIVSFALYGFPESHAASFALIAYASAWLKCHHQAAFVTALLNCWPMGFYSPCTLVQDARRHGIRVLPININKSEWLCTLSDNQDNESNDSAEKGPDVRLGMRYINGLGQSAAFRIVRERELNGPYPDITAVGERTGLGRTELLLLADAGAAPGTDNRRDAVWQAMAFDSTARLLHRSSRSDDHEPDSTATPDDAASQYSDQSQTERLPDRQTCFEDMLDDFRTTGLTVGRHPMAFARTGLSVLTARDLASMLDGARASVAGMVIVRQRPPTARGFYFATIEDETGHAAVAVRPDVFAENRVLLSTCRFLVFSGVVQNRDGVVSLLADRFHPLDIPVQAISRSFH